MTADEILDLRAEDQPIWSYATVGKVLDEHLVSASEAIRFTVEVKRLGAPVPTNHWRSGEVLAWLGY